MGLLDKVKNMFTEEIDEEVEVPVKKEVMKVEIESPRVSRSVEVQPKKEVMRERPTFDDLDFEPVTKKEEVKEMIREVKRESKPAPIYFDDSDFKELEKPKPKPKKTERRKDVYSGKPAVQPEKKVFKPTPIISPVYGILDKNYQKDEIVNKNEHRASAYGRTMSIDEVRKKAYGKPEKTVVEETTRRTSYEVTGNTEVLEDLILDVKEQLGEIPKTKFENNLNSIENELNNLEDTLVGMKRPVKKEVVTDSNELNLGDDSVEPINKIDDNVINENDLFDLIDSMYEKRDEE